MSHRSIKKTGEMDIFEKSLLLLDEYFSKTSPSMVEESMHIVDNMHMGGPTLAEYFSGFESEFLYKEWLQIIDASAPLIFDESRKVSHLNFDLKLDNHQYYKTVFFSELQEDFFATDSTKIAA